MKKSRNELLILDVNPYGYLTDTVKWIEYLRQDWDISLICFKSKDGEPSRPTNVEFSELPNSRNRKIKGFVFLFICIWKLLFFHGKVLVVYFQYCEILKKIFPRKRMLLDIRTLAVNPDPKARRNANDRIKVACKIYGKVSVISKGVGDELGLNNAFILPLGSDVISSELKDYTKAINLLYVGTLNNREIDKTILGTFTFITKNPDIPLHYSIIGYGKPEEEEKIRDLIRINNLEKHIHFIGRVNHSGLHQFFKESNVGVSFVPITSYFNFQPPTKTFEYSLSGLFCIATKTYANAEVIDKRNGYLIEDSSDDFCRALNYFWEKRFEIDYDEVSKSLKDYSWSNLVKNILHPILRDL